MEEIAKREKEREEKIMDYDYNSPCALYFEDQIFTLVDGTPKADDSRTDDTVMYLSFYVLAGEVNLSVYDEVKNERTENFEGDSLEEYLELLDHIEARYSRTAPAEFRTLVSDFYANRDESFSVHTNLAEEIYICDTCGDSDMQEIQGFYFPAVNSEVPASIAVYQEGGCFGGPSVSGIASEVYDEALKLMKYALETGDSKSGKDELKSFIQQLEKLQLS